jgi:hypothetical protein
MTQPVKNNGDGDSANAKLIEQQLELLSDIQIIKFAANPSHVQPFQNTTVSYQVKLPTALKAPVTFSIGSNTFLHALQGSASFNVTANTTFALHAATSLTGMNIATTAVTVDTSGCRPGTIDGFGISATIKSKLDPAFADRLRSGGSTATLGVGIISIKVPLTLGGTRTMDIDIELAVRLAGQTVSVIDTGVTVKVNLDTIADVDSWCSNASAQIAQPFMQHIVDNELIPALQQGFLDQVNGVISAAEKGDHLHRTFALTSFVLTSNGVTFLVCPTSPGIVVGGGTVTTAAKSK